MRVTSEVTSWFRQAGEWVRATGSIFKGGMKVTATSDVTPPSDPTIDPRTDAVQEPATDITSWKRHRGEVVRTNGTQPKDGVFTNTLPSGVPPSRVTGLVVVPGDQKNDLAWDAATDDDGIAGYDIQYRINRQILSLDGSYTYPDAESLQLALMTRYGIFGIDYLGKTYVGYIDSSSDPIVPDVNSWTKYNGEWVLCAGIQPKGGVRVTPLEYVPPDPPVPIEGTFVSFSRANFSDVTFANIEIGARFVSGLPGLVVRSNNGAGTYGWSAYTAIFSETDVKIYKVVNGVLGSAQVTCLHDMQDKWCSLRAQGTRISVLVDDVEICYFIDSAYYNGVVGITCGEDGGVWDFGLNYYETAIFTGSLAYTHENLTTGLEYQYRVRAFDIPGWHGEVSIAASGIPILPIPLDINYSLGEIISVAFAELSVSIVDSPAIAIDLNETVAISFSGLSISVIDSPTIAVDIAETVSISVTSLSITVATSPAIAVDLGETVSIGVNSLSIVVSSILQTPVGVAETVNIAVNPLSIVVNSVDSVAVPCNETISIGLQNLSITVSSA